MPAQKPRAYIAGPFFNPAQVAIIERIEDTLHRMGFKYYSPRRDSGSADMTPEERKDFGAWEPVMQSNINAVYQTHFCIAVVEYALPPEQAAYVVTDDQFGHLVPVRRIEVPDAGTMFEVGAFRMAQKPVALFHSQRMPRANLMLSHGATSLLCGWDAFEEFLESYEPGRFGPDGQWFDWKQWHPAKVVKEIE
jgi:nucleoside 2-deoxyribosyltransferase